MTSYEKYLNKNDDVDTVLSHYKSTGFQQERSTKSAAANIMDFISDRLNSQISIFGVVTNVPRPIKSTRKRRHCARPAIKPSPKRVKPAHEVEVSRRTSLPLGEENSDDAVGVNSHIRDNNLPDCLDSPNLNEEIHVPNRQLPHSLTGNSEMSVLFGDPVGCLDELGSHPGPVGPVSNAETAQVDRELEPYVVTNTSFQSNNGPGSSQNSPLALSIPSPSNAAHLMDGFQVESMQNLYLGDFDRTGNIDAAQLMQQFDWFNGHYSL